jgi:cytochrome bd ubiquinol oxidase subunit I
MDMDPILLARIQFAANITFHILFPTITIALGWILLFFKLQFNRTQDQKWIKSYFFYTKIFALTFAMGVVSGITMSLQFGTNWPGFMETVGNVAGPLLAYEVLTAFFLEATFLGIMLFGFKRVPTWLHNLATFIVAAGTTLSAFWILALNSWMQTPAGFEMIEGVAHVTSWFEVIFNPSFIPRLTHMLLASGLTAAFLIAGVAGFRYLIGDKSAPVMAALKTGLTLGLILMPLQILAGDNHGLNTLKNQPAKVAAMEANWETKGNVPLVLFAIPNEKTKSNDYEITIPNVASLILTHRADGVVPGLDQFEGNHPPVAPVFFAFRIMVGVGMLMLLTSIIGIFQLVRKNKINLPTQLLVIAMTFSGWVATIAGWYVTEIGRQPWLVTNVLLTKDAAAAHPTPILNLSLTLYLLIYVFLLFSYISTIIYLAKQASKGEK